MTSTATTPDTVPSSREADAGPAGPDAERAARPAPDAARPGVRRFGWWLAGITAAGLAVRLVYLVGWRSPWPVIGDPYYYHQGANLLADGEGYVHPYQFLLFGVRTPGADHPPGFMTVLAGFSWLGFRSFFQHQVIACVIGATGVATIGVAGRRIAGERVGLIAAVLAALSPNLFYFDAMVVSESMMVATTAAILWAAYRWWDRPTLGSALTFGVVIGVAALVRSESILLGPLIAVPLVWWRHRGAREGAPVRRRAGWAPQLGAAGLAAVVVVAPWVGYNLSRFEEPTTLSAQLDQTIGTANCETVYEGDRVGYWSLACIQETEHLVPEGDASVQGRGFRELAFDYAREHRDRVPYVVAARIGRTFGLYQPQEQLLLDRSVDQKEIVLGQVGMVLWYGIAVAGGIGLIGLRRAGRPIFPIVAVVGSVVVVVALVYGNTRFRLPAELALMVPAAVSLDAALGGARRWWDAWNAERRAVGAAAVANPPAPDTDGEVEGREATGVDAEGSSEDTAVDPPGGSDAVSSDVAPASAPPSPRPTSSPVSGAGGLAIAAAPTARRSAFHASHQRREPPRAASRDTAAGTISASSAGSRNRVLPYTSATPTTTLPTTATIGKIGRPARRSPIRPMPPATAMPYQTTMPTWPSTISFWSTDLSSSSCSWGW